MEPRRLPSDDLIRVDEEESKQVITLTARATDRTLFSTDLLSMALGMSAQCTGGRVKPKPRAE